MQKLTQKMLDEMVEKELQGESVAQRGKNALDKLLRVARLKGGSTETGEVK